MSLFDKLKDTKFKSLKFGNDKPGGGTSPEPIIQQPIKDNNLVGMEKTVADTAAENRDRISKLIKSTPRGINFITKQKGLQLSNARLELPKGNIFGAGVNKSTRLTPITFYNKETLLAQEGGDVGDHFDRFGLTPFMEDSYKYINIATSNNTTKNNRLVGLQNKLETKYYKLTPGVSIAQSSVNILKSKVKGILGGISTFTNTLAGISNIFGGSPFLNQLNNKISGISRLVSPFLDPQIDQYIGGPGSRFGVGTTNIRRFDYTNDLDKFNSLKELSDTKARSSKIDRTNSNLYGASLGYNNSSYIEEDINFILTPISPIKSQFQQLQEQKTKKPSVSYGGSNISVGAVNTNYSYKTKVLPQLDPQNFGLDKHSKTSNYITNLSNRLDGMYDRNDGENMSVVFQLINPFTAQNLHRIIFPAYINGFKVNSNATWNDVSYIGRSESLYVYSKFKRTVSFNLQIPCFNIIELRERHRALGALESSLAGQYNDNKLGGILTKLYLGNYLKGETGIINDISYDVPNDSSWDIDEQLAHNINVSINFTVIHNDLPTYRREGGFFSKTIPNGANYFISSKEALANTGATSGTFNKDIPNKFTKITRQKDNSPVGNLANFKITPSDANDNILSNNKNIQTKQQTPTTLPTKTPYAPSNLQSQLENKIQPLPR